MREETRDLSIGQALDLGVGLAMAGQHKDATEMFRGVLMREPANFEAINRLGSSLFELGELHEALYLFWRARKISPRHPMALTNYGLTLSQLGHLEEAIPDLERAVYQAERNQQISPAAKALIYNNLGNTLHRVGRYAEALVALDKGILCDPNDPFPRYNKGVTLLRLNRQREAIEELDLSLAMRDPVTDSASRLNAADAHYNRGMGRLLLGDLKGGFEDYEYRLLTTENRLPNLGLPADKKWKRGQSIEGKTVLVCCEQGLGDSIQFFRFILPLAEKKPGYILIAAPDAVKPLLAGLPLARTPTRPGFGVLSSGQKLEAGAYDCWVALMSLPLMLGVEKEADIPPPWKPQVGCFHMGAIGMARRDFCETRQQVGVCWAGNFLHKNDRHRSIPLETLAPLFSAPGVDFVSLQQLRPMDVEPLEACKVKYPNLSAVTTETLLDLAVVMTGLDLVITVDTAVAHLAGSLGVPTWILLPKFSCDWRWQLERTDSPWYSSVRLIRQAKIGEWLGTLKYVKEELAREVDRRAATRAA